MLSDVIVTFFSKERAVLIFYASFGALWCDVYKKNTQYLYRLQIFEDLLNVHNTVLFYCVTFIVGCAGM